MKRFGKYCTGLAKAVLAGAIFALLLAATPASAIIGSRFEQGDAGDTGYLQRTMDPSPYMRLNTIHGGIDGADP